LWFAPYFYTKDQKECKQTKQHDTWAISLSATRIYIFYLFFLE
jgi:hypothetical protein